MATLKLFWQMTVRSAMFGMIIGTLGGTAFGAIFANVLLASGVIAQGSSAFSLREIPTGIVAVLFVGFIGSVAGGIFGVPTGLVVGLFNGLLMAVTTRVFFFPLRDPAKYRRVLAIISAIFTASVSWFCFFSIALFYSKRGAANVPGIAGFMLVPALVAGGCAWFMAPRIVQWYVDGK